MLKHILHIICKTTYKVVLFLLSLCILLIISGYAYTYYKENTVPLIIPQSLNHIESNGESITYLEYGNPENQPVVFLHGTGANSFIWETTSRYLANRGYYVIAIDIPPFGWSSIPDNQDYRKEQQARRIVAVLIRLAIHNPIVVGHSFNSKVALQIASTYPSKKLILVAPVLDYIETPPKSALSLMSIPYIRDPLLSLFVNNTLLAKKLLLSFMYNKDADITSPLDMTILPFNKPGVNHAYGEWFKEFFNPTSLLSDVITLRQLNIPVTVLWGDKDTIAPISNFESLHKVHASTTRIILENVGHMPHLESPDLFNTKILEALN